MTVLWCLGAALLGYVARVSQERYLQLRRERVIQALRGELPDWEKHARALEDSADRYEINDAPESAKADRRKAARMRRVALRRLRLGRSALPS
jgi:hypothetical protein